MKKVLCAAIAFMFLLSACGNASKPTGYPAGEVQRVFLFCDGKLYSTSGGSAMDHPESKGYTLLGTVTKVTNTMIPTEEFAAAHLEVGAKIYRADQGGATLYAETEEGHYIQLSIYNEKQG